MKRCLLLLVFAACNKGASEDQCKQLLSHLVDLEFKKAGASATTKDNQAELAKQKQNVLDNKQSEFVAVCTEKTVKARVECALAATDLDAVAKCDATN